MLAEGAAVTCPECGADNRGTQALCRMCGAALGASVGRRVQRKVLLRTDFVAAARANQKRTRHLIAMLLAVTALVGYLVGWNLQLLSAAEPPPPAHPVWFLSSWGVLGAMFLFGLGVLWGWLALRKGDAIVLALAGATEVTPQQEPQLHHVVEEMALAAGLPKPRVFVLDTYAMNAFATGTNPKGATVCVTRGLLKQLTRQELQGVVGHEMGHIINMDVRYATAVAVIVGLVALVSDGILHSVRYGGGRGIQRVGRRGANAGMLALFLVTLLLAALAPLSARLVQMAVSRQREFLADATSVRLTRDPQGLISALEKLAVEARPFPGANRATQHMFIVNPLRNFGDRAAALMATHPPIERRIRRLKNLDGRA